MKASNFHTGPNNDHVSMELLRQYQAGALPPAEEHRVEKHLLDCDLCTDILVGMAASPEPVTQRAVQEINTRIAASSENRRKIIPFYSEWKNYGVAAAILLLIFSGALVIYYNFTNLKTAEKTIAAEKTEPAQPTETTLKPAEAEPAIAQAAPAATTEPRHIGTNILQNPAIALNKPKVQSAAPSLKSEESQGDMRPNEAFSEAIVMDALLNQSTSAPASPQLSEVEVADAKLKKDVIGNAATSVAVDSLVMAKSVKMEPVLQGRVAGVQTGNSETKNIRIRGTTSSPVLNEARVTGRAVVGKVFSEEGEALPGVTIIIKGTPAGTTTSPSGEYVLAVPQGINKATLVFSYIGYDTTEKQVAIKPASPVALNIELKPDAQALSEVVVVDYGTQRKSDVTAAIAYAKPIAGMKSFKKYIQANLKYPEAAKREKIKGRVVVGFSVSPDGSLSNFNIIRSLTPETDAEALRLVREGPRWEPTRKDNVAVTEQVRIAIRFKPPR